MLLLVNFKQKSRLNMLSQKQLELRRTGLGGSDISCIAGLNPWKTPLSLYLEKVGLQEPEDLSDSSAVYFGHLLEDVVAKEYAKRTKSIVSLEPKTLRHPKHDFMLANIDRWVGNKEHVLECKTTGVFKKDEWGEEGTDDIPANYLLQCAWYAAVCDVPKVDIAVLIGGQEFRIYTYKRNAELEANIINLAYNFWHNHVLKEIPPAPSTPADLSALFPKDNGGEAIATEEVIQKAEELKALKASEKTLTERVKSLQAEIQNFMEDKAALISDQGEVIATWKSTKPRSTFDSKRFSEDHRDLYHNYIKESKPSRMFLLK